MAIQYYTIASTGQKYALDKATGQAQVVSSIPAGAPTVTWGGSGLPPELQNAGVQASPQAAAYQAPAQSIAYGAVNQPDVQVNYDPNNLASMESALTQLSKTARSAGDYQTLAALQQKVSQEQARQASLKSQAQSLLSSGAGSTQLNNFYATLSPQDKQIVSPMLGNQVSSSYAAPSSNNLLSISSRNGITSSSASGTYPTANLQPGDTGPAVQQLQQYLVAQGYMTQAQMNSGPGTYGPQTKAAVAAMQQKLGVDNSSGPGYWGPKTISALQSAPSTANTGGGGGTPGGALPAGGDVQGTIDWLNQNGYGTLGQALQISKNYADTNLALGNTVNPNLQITPDLVTKFLQEAHSTVDPHYQQQLDTVIQDVNRNMQLLGSQYGIDQSSAGAQFGQDLATERNNAGGNGVAFSGGRGLTENNMLGAFNRNLGSLDLTYGQKAGDVLRTGAGMVGSDTLGLNGNLNSFQLPSMASKTGTLEGARGGLVDNGSVQTNYNPGLYKYGSIPSNFASDLTSQSNQFLSSYQKSAANNSARTFSNINGTPTLM